MIERPSRLSAFLPAILIAAGLVVGLGVWVAGRDGDLQYDDAVYLERGAFHARQVAAKPLWQRPFRLAYSLRFEQPKPPLFHGWVASTALLMGTSPPGRWAAVSALVPFAALACLVAWGGARQGRVAGLLALAALVSMPLQLSLGTSVMVEPLLAAIVTACALLAESELEQPSAAGALLLGAGCGLAALTKFTAPAFLALLVLAVVLASARSSGTLHAVRRVVLIGSAVLLIAGPWYWFWGREALDFARFAAEFPAWADSGSAWTRPFRLLTGGLGVPLTLVCGTLLALPAGRARAEAGAMSSRRRWFWICILVSVPSAVAVLLSPNFDPRFWAPCLGPVAIAVGRRASELLAGPLKARLGLAALAIALPALSIVGVLQRPHVPTPWAVGDWLASRTPSTGRPPRVCTLGRSPSWNVYKLRLVVELARIGWLREVHELPAWKGSANASPATCDIVFALDPVAVPADRVHEFSNFELRARVQGLELSGLEICEPCKEDLGAGFRGAVWVRRESGPGASAVRRTMNPSAGIRDGQAEGS